MREAIEAATAWHREGRAVAIATLVRIDGSGPRDPGAMLALDDAGRIAGSISSGCIETDVVERAERVLASGRAESATYVAAAAAAEPFSLEAGLTCGAGVEVWIAPLERAATADGGWCARALAALVSGATIEIAVPAPERTGAAVSVRDAAESREARVEDDAEGRRFVRTIGRRPEMIVFGAVDFARAVATVGKFLGYAVTVVDARGRFATPERMPDADRVVVAWPDEYMQGRAIAADTALVVLTHDERFDVPLLAVALESDAGYVGVMGSRTTHARRLAALRELGVSESRLARMHAPIGLDIGARTPEGVAISIAAEILAIRGGRRGGFLRESAPAVHASASLARA